MKRQILLALTLVVTATACDSVNTLKARFFGEAEQTDTTTESTPATAEAPEKLCPNGDKPQILQGTCSGQWKIRKEGQQTNCEFEWGPMIKCPAETKSLTYEAVCYGSTVKTDSSVSSVSDCESKFGKFPASPNYELQCCGT